ncbi:relaxase domain-containing protein [Geomonas sp. Red69]|uniref:relaxase domain-containing protein n=1 Tax=Geomonas diazotrophica TaxID=2843197 RepID=UPI001C11790D|nr:relaxase domain-containing protein [Geomonas diazotrophica]
MECTPDRPGIILQREHYLRGNDQGVNSRWFGRGAESLGRSGPVREEEFPALCAGRHPLSQELLVVPKTI